MHWVTDACCTSKGGFQTFQFINPFSPRQNGHHFAENIFQCISMNEQGKSEGFESCDRPIVRKRPIWVKIGDVLSRVTLKFDIDLGKQ